MIKLFLLGCVSLVTAMTFAQNNLGASDDAARIAMTAYVDPSLGFNKEVSKQLKNKLNAILTRQGLAGNGNQRFIITANADILSEDIIVTTKEMYQYELEVHFAVGDGIEGTKFSMASQIVKGLGETKAGAYLAAIKKIKPSDPVFQEMVKQAKNKIIEYYNSKCDFIITEAETLAKKQDYNAAIFKLMAVPDVCKDCYDKCMAAVQPIYQAIIDEDGQRKLTEAKAIWAAGYDATAADAASAVLVQINPQSSAFKAAETLNAEIAQRMKELDQREWDFILKQQQDEVELEKASINAMREIGVAYAENQPDVTYTLVGWW